MPIYHLQKGAAGLPFTNFYDADTGILQDAPEFFPQGGQAIFKKAGEEEAVTTKNEGAKFVGIQILNDVGLEKHQGDCIAYMKRGQIWVSVTGDIEAGSAAKYDPATGKFGTAGTVDINGIFKTNGQAGDIAIVEFDALGVKE